LYTKSSGLVKQAEMETLVASKEELGNDRPDATFFALGLPKAVGDKPWMKAMSRTGAGSSSRA
jgi:hypothetical protein